jgi:hypothetical protein
MPAKNEKQRRLMAMALHSPSKVSKKNSGVLGMSKKQLRDFSSKSKHQNAVRSAFMGDEGE